MKKGHENSGPFFVLRSLPGIKSHTRWAVLVGKKIAPLSTDRNRKRRQIYAALQELIQQNALGNLANLDIIVLARKPALKLCVPEMKTTLIQQVQSLNS